MYKTARNLTVLGAGLGISAAIGWLLLREAKRDREAPSVLIKSQHRSTEPADMPKILLPLDSLDEQEATLVTSGKDDLTAISDIGPRFAEALHRVGITGYAQLAEQTPETLAEKLSGLVTVRAQRIRAKDWIGQAAQLAKN